MQHEDWMVIENWNVHHLSFSAMTRYTAFEEDPPPLNPEEHIREADHTINSLPPRIVASDTEDILKLIACGYTSDKLLQDNPMPCYEHVCWWQ